MQRTSLPLVLLFAGCPSHPAAAPPAAGQRVTSPAPPGAPSVPRALAPKAIVPTDPKEWLTREATELSAGAEDASDIIEKTVSAPKLLAAPFWLGHLTQQSGHLCDQSTELASPPMPIPAELRANLAKVRTAAAALCDLKASFGWVAAGDVEALVALQQELQGVVGQVADADDSVTGRTAAPPPAQP